MSKNKLSLLIILLFILLAAIWLNDMRSRSVYYLDWDAQTPQNKDNSQ